MGREWNLSTGIGGGFSCCDQRFPMSPMEPMDSIALSNEDDVTFSSTHRSVAVKWELVRSCDLMHGRFYDALSAPA
jgi:hypothetical protein